MANRYVCTKLGLPSVERPADAVLVHAGQVHRQGRGECWQFPAWTRCVSRRRSSACQAARFTGRLRSADRAPLRLAVDVRSLAGGGVVWSVRCGSRRPGKQVPEEAGAHAPDATGAVPPPAARTDPTGCCCTSVPTGRSRRCWRGCRPICCADSAMTASPRA